MPRVIVGKWGKNLAVRLPSEVAQSAGLAEGARVEMEASEGEIVIRRISRPPTVEDLFRGKDAAAWRALYAGVFDWGADLGREAVEE